MLLFLMLACGESEPCIEPKSDAKSGQTSEEAASKGGKGGDGVMISKKEAALLDGYLVDLRKGIREWNSESIGVCKGKSRNCEEYLGKEVKLMDEGTYSVRAEFQAPELQPEGGWKVEFSIECEITRKKGDSETKTNKTYSKTYDGIAHRPEGGNGYRLSPLYSMKSPSSRGEENCTWRIEGNNLEEPMVWEGSYYIPAKEAK